MYGYCKIYYYSIIFFSVRTPKKRELGVAEPQFSVHRLNFPSTAPKDNK